MTIDELIEMMADVFAEHADDYPVLGFWLEFPDDWIEFPDY